MSTNLYWRPILPEPDGECLSKALKFAISRKLWDTDGSCGSGEQVLTEAHISFLEGMMVVGSVEIVRDCQTLIDAINKYGAISLWHQG